VSVGVTFRIKYRAFKVRQVQIRATVIREDKRGKPVALGQWGVNPISTLRKIQFGNLGHDHRLPRLVVVERIPLMPRCAECLDVWLAVDEERWRAYLYWNDALVFYCSDCSERDLKDR
jgi:hypothetical protein